MLTFYSHTKTNSIQILFDTSLKNSAPSKKAIKYLPRRRICGNTLLFCTRTATRESKDVARTAEYLPTCHRDLHPQHFQHLQPFQALKLQLCQELQQMAPCKATQEIEVAAHHLMLLLRLQKFTITTTSINTNINMLSDHNSIVITTTKNNLPTITQSSLSDDICEISRWENL